MSRESRLLLGLFVSAAIVLALAQFALLGARRIADFGAGLAFNTWLLAALWLPFEACARHRGRARHAAWLALPLVSIVVGLVFAHAWFFDVAIERRLTVSDMTRAGVAYFFTTALPWAGLLALLACCALMMIGAALFVRRARPALSRTALALCAVIQVLTLPLIVRAERVASPLFDSALELYEVAALPKLRGPGKVQPGLLASLDKLSRTRTTPPVSFDKLIVLVMETMPAERFERERRELAPTSFLRAEAAHMLEFERYYPNNQDSRTGMLDMLFAQLIPYEAYSEEGYAGYRHLARAPSLVERMTELGFATAFAVSQTALEDVVGELAWTSKLHLTEAQMEAAKREGKLCFAPDEWETSCEDRVLLPSVVDFVASHERAFVYQEFIWGHAIEYNDASGKSNAQYYSEYADELVAALRARGLAERTLIAITSDHGFRDKGRQHDPEVYRVPLLFHAPRLSARRDTRLLSHVDFGLLSFELLTPSAPRVQSNPIVMIVGPTGQGHLFAVGAQGETMLLRKKLGVTTVVAREGRWETRPEDVLATFERYRAQFAAAGKAAPR